MAPTSAVPSRARMKRVRRSPRQAARGGVMLSGISVVPLHRDARGHGFPNIPGSTPNHLLRTMSELMKLPKIALLKPAEPIPVARTMTSCFHPGLVYPSLHSCSPTAKPGSIGSPSPVELPPIPPPLPGRSPNRWIVKRPRTKLRTAARHEMSSACKPSNVILAISSARRVWRWSSSPMLAEVPSRADRHISRLPLRLPIMGTRMNSSSTRRKTRHRARCSSSSPVNTRPMSETSSDGVDCGQ